MHFPTARPRLCLVNLVSWCLFTPLFSFLHTICFVFGLGYCNVSTFHVLDMPGFLVNIVKRVGYVLLPNSRVLHHISALFLSCDRTELDFIQSQLGEYLCESTRRRRARACYFGHNRRCVYNKPQGWGQLKLWLRFPPAGPFWALWPSFQGKKLPESCEGTRDVDPCTISELVYLPTLYTP